MPTSFSNWIAAAPRRTRRLYVRNAWRAARSNNWGDPAVTPFSFQEAWASYDPADCGPQTWSRVIERNNVRCIR